MSKNYVIKPANNQDIPRIVQLVNLAYRGGDAAGWTSEGAYLDGERTNAFMISELMAKVDSVFLKAEEESGAAPGAVSGAGSEPASRAVSASAFSSASESESASVSASELASRSGKIVGCVYLEVEEGHLHLGTFAVDPGIQAQGLGRMMLSYADKYALEHGFDAIYITVVSVRSELIDWYIRRGFEATGRRIPFPEQFGAPRMAVDFIEMRRRVS